MIESFDPAAESPERLRKSPEAFRTISEVADDLHVPQHVLRFWETRFPEVRPLKRGGGRRYYRPEDITILRRISDLLYVQGYTIKGVQRVLREGDLPVDRVEAETTHESDVDAAPAQHEVIGAVESDVEPGVDEDVVEFPALPESPVQDAVTPPSEDIVPADDIAREIERLRRDRQVLRTHLLEVLEELDALRQLIPTGGAS